MSHQHAENMRLYAEDASRLDEPWENWQFKPGPNSEWVNMLGHPLWANHLEYRRKPSTVVIGRKEFFKEDVYRELVRMSKDNISSNELAIALLEHFEVDLL